MSSSSDVAAAGGGCNEKTSWPEVVGLCAEEAKKVILKDKPYAKIEVLPVGTIVPLDVDDNRVRIFIDIVAEVPRVG